VVRVNKRRKNSFIPLLGFALVLSIIGIAIAATTDQVGDFLNGWELPPSVLTENGDAVVEQGSSISQTFEDPLEKYGEWVFSVRAAEGHRDNPGQSPASFTGLGGMGLTFILSINGNPGDPGETQVSFIGSSSKFDLSIEVVEDKNNPAVDDPPNGSTRAMLFFGPDLNYDFIGSRPTDTPVHTPTPTETPSVTPTPSESPSPVGSPTPTPTPTPDPAESPEPTPVQTPIPAYIDLTVEPNVLILEPIVGVFGSEVMATVKAVVYNNLGEIDTSQIMETPRASLGEVSGDISRVSNRYEYLYKPAILYGVNGYTARIEVTYGELREEVEVEVIIINDLVKRDQRASVEPGVRTIYWKPRMR
jgi:hypothetical protein